jgi:hypothetical protein
VRWWESVRPQKGERARRARGQGMGACWDREQHLFSRGRASWIGETNWDREDELGPGRRPKDWGSELGIGESGALASGVAKHRGPINGESRGEQGLDILSLMTPSP